jgi:hypothetical protein
MVAREDNLGKKPGKTGSLALIGNRPSNHDKKNPEKTIPITNNKLWFCYG